MQTGIEVEDVDKALQTALAAIAEAKGRDLRAIVVGGRVFVTASEGPKQDRLRVLALDARSGKQLWQRTFWATGPTASLTTPPLP